MRFGLAILALLFASGAAAETRDVVFLLGEDEPGKVAFFTPAQAYYRVHEPGARLVASARSLAEVREYLVRHRPGAAWNRITLVAHGAPWIGMEAAVFSGDGTADLGTLESAHATGEFPPMPPGVIDVRTRLVIESCGLGRRPDVLRALAELLSSTDGARMQVDSPSGFVAFQSGRGRARRFELAFVHAIVPRRAEVRSDAALQAVASRLRAELGSLGAAASEEIHPIHVSIAWSVDRERLRGDPHRALKADPVLRRRLATHGFGLDDLAWSLRPVAEAGVQVDGRADMIVVREALPGL